jgi:cytochrome c peroxidase
MYAPFGVVEKPGADILPPTDKGRFTVTKTASDEYVFKVPALRNIRLTAPYFHSGQAWDLGQAVAVMGSSQLGTQLSADEVSKITAGRCKAYVCRRVSFQSTRSFTTRLPMR